MDKMNAPDSLKFLRPPDHWHPEVDRALVRLTARREAERVRGRRRTWALAAAALTAVGLLSFPVTRALAGRCVDACVAETSKVTSLLQPRPAGPAFEFTDVYGDTIHLAAFKGKVVLLNFWATWCSPCKAEIPWFMEFHTPYCGTGLVVLGAALDEGGWNTVTPFVQKLGVNYRLLKGPADAVDALPTTLLIDRAGRVAFTHTGLIPKEQYRSELESLLKAP